MVFTGIVLFLSMYHPSFASFSGIVSDELVSSFLRVCKNLKTSESIIQVNALVIFTAEVKDNRLDWTDDLISSFY